ncbi:T9SS type A sorting domain-containing protein [Aureispira anguillae]|uniref:T9SS type A sorting domain-containing protein n=1 Tax=Aureispira anguillae TaxID=2864201 RepID=A0A915YIK5_9BACT|nr:T9SS type A sorting domain-containing protein [Aureispira anguillae]BDS13865.1 T9SS type A sorting domain-containing protein [Aureispira anguillae]
MQILFLIPIFFLLAVHTTDAQTTSIPDTAFEQKLITLGFDSDNTINGQVLTSDIANVSVLSLAGSSTNIGNIRDLTGIEDFTNLWALDCSWNQISSLQISGLNDLEMVHCSYNQLSSLDLMGNSRIREIICSSNQLNSLNVSGLSNLQLLSCSQNNLSSLDISTNTGLIQLYCGINPLQQIDISNNPLLERVECIHGQLTQLDISNNLDLKWLRCENNQLSFLDISNHPQLYQVLAQNNQLDSIKMDNCPLLERLHCSNNQLTELDLSNFPNLNGFTAINNQLTHVNIQNGNNFGLSVFDVTNNPSNLVICVDNIHWIPNHWQKDPAATYSSICRVTLAGLVRLDSNNNCSPDSMEQLMHSQVIKITQGTNISYATTNNNGSYIAGLDTGTYTLELVPPAPYWTPCPLVQSTTTDSTYSIDTVDWTIAPNVECPLLIVDISAPFIRATGGGSAYTINYCNNGTAAANSPYVEVTIDSFLNVLNTSIPIVSQTGHWYRFDLDTIPIGGCGSFTIQVIADTSAIIGQTHCSEVHIYPDSICLSPWNGPILNANGQCLNDTIYFKIKNTGSNMLSANNYSIFEDDVIIDLAPFNLGAGDSIVVVQVAAPGKTYRIQTNQVTGFPAIMGSSMIHATIEACNLQNGGFNTGFVTQYYTGNSSPFIAIDCQQSIAAYDPNDKSAQPEGYGIQHYITNNTPLEYRVRFQNTGNDTAFTIVVVDTLSPFVDPTSLQMGASSHNYTWSLSGANVLTVVFDQILLVDSNANEPLSHGFFSYTIHPLAALANGTVILNQAAIYFDYNFPIWTNTTYHTIGENYVPIILKMEEVWSSDLQLHIYPNPTTGLVYLEKSNIEPISISLIDHLGRTLMTKNVATEQSYIDLKRFSSGIYYIHVKTAKQHKIQKVIKY